MRVVNFYRKKSRCGYKLFARQRQGGRREQAEVCFQHVRYGYPILSRDIDSCSIFGIMLKTALTLYHTIPTFIDPSKVNF